MTTLRHPTRLPMPVRPRRLPPIQTWESYALATDVFICPLKDALRGKKPTPEELAAGPEAAKAVWGSTPTLLRAAVQSWPYSSAEFAEDVGTALAVDHLQLFLDAGGSYLAFGPFRHEAGKRLSISGTQAFEEYMHTVFGALAERELLSKLTHLSFLPEMDNAHRRKEPAVDPRSVAEYTALGLRAAEAAGWQGQVVAPPYSPIDDYGMEFGRGLCDALHALGVFPDRFAIHCYPQGVAEGKTTNGAIAVLKRGFAAAAETWGIPGDCDQASVPPELDQAAFAAALVEACTEHNVRPGWYPLQAKSTTAGPLGRNAPSPEAVAALQQWIPG